MSVQSEAKTAVLDFSKFKHAVAAQFAKMQKHELFTVAIEGDVLWAAYLASFPEGTNPVLRKRSEHDCACCRSFVKKAGKLVAIIDGKLESIWDVAGAAMDPAYAVVAKALAARVKSAEIAGPFLTVEKTLGTDKSFEKLIGGDSTVKTWEHFFVNVPAKCLVAKKDDIGPKLSEARATHDVMLRSLKEIGPAAVETVLELIGQNSLYRGEENKFTVEAFEKIQDEYLNTIGDDDVFVWARVASTSGSVARIRNTAIGTLLVDLSEGKEVEDAVKAFEAVVAPANYKRPTALVTKAQVEKAKAAIEALGLTSALERRYATIDDINVRDVLFKDSIAKKLDADVFDLVETKKNDKSFKKVEEIPIEKFLSDVLPKATGLEVFVENRHASNLVSLVAPADPTAGKLFKWDNGFSWSYNGDVADSLKERVKKAGGNVTGELCCRLAWDYTDDLDFHMCEPGYRISYPVKRRKSPNGGMLDLDANGGDGMVPEPAENIYYEKLSSMCEGPYRLEVNNYCRRSTGKGFEIEIDILGAVTRISYDKVLRDKETIHVATLARTKDGVQIVESLPSASVSKKLWGLSSQDFHKVSAVTLSPNFWAGNVGNRHYFFFIEGCANDGKTRGFYNEFLDGRLEAHRKTLEIVGSKMRTEKTDQQLSGLGFSSTQRNELLVRVSGAFKRVVKVVF